MDIKPRFCLSASFSVYVSAKPSEIVDVDSRRQREGVEELPRFVAPGPRRGGPDAATGRTRCQGVGRPGRRRVHARQAAATIGCC